MLGMHNRTSWPIERVNKLVALLDEGYSANQAAAAMGCSRNSIIGVAHRKNLAFKFQSTLYRPKVAPIARPATPRRTTPFRPQARADRKAPPPLPAAEDATDISPTRRLSLLELKDYHCRWPHGDVGTVDFHFCGGMAIEGKPYCMDHCRMAYRQPGQREEQAA